MSLKDLRQLFICLVRMGSLWCPSQLSVLHQDLRTDTGLCSCDMFTDSPRGIFSFPHPTSLQMEGVGNVSSGLIPFVLDSTVQKEAWLSVMAKWTFWNPRPSTTPRPLLCFNLQLSHHEWLPCSCTVLESWVPWPCSTVLPLFAIPWGSVPGREEEDPEKSWSTEHSPGDTIFF